jgi:hypothetical protein
VTWRIGIGTCVVSGVGNFRGCVFSNKNLRTFLHELMERARPRNLRKISGDFFLLFCKKKIPRNFSAAVLICT